MPLRFLPLPECEQEGVENRRNYNLHALSVLEKGVWVR